MDRERDTASLEIKAPALPTASLNSPAVEAEGVVNEGGGGGEKKERHFRTM